MLEEANTEYERMDGDLNNMAYQLEELRQDIEEKVYLKKLNFILTLYKKNNFNDTILIYYFNYSNHTMNVFLLLIWHYCFKF